jgi:hypothetical protein
MQAKPFLKWAGGKSQLITEPEKSFTWAIPVRLPISNQVI